MCDRHSYSKASSTYVCIRSNIHTNTHILRSYWFQLCWCCLHRHIDLQTSFTSSFVFVVFFAHEISTERCEVSHIFCCITFCFSIDSFVLWIGNTIPFDFKCTSWQPICKVNQTSASLIKIFFVNLLASSMKRDKFGVIFFSN